MNRTLRAVLPLSAIVLSCAVPVGPIQEEALPTTSARASENENENENENESATANALHSEPDGIGEREPLVVLDEEPVHTAIGLVPTGVFPSIAALCQAQKQLIAPELRKIATERQEQPAVASCVESKTALSHARVDLRAPYLEVRAIEIETGEATDTNLVVRTADGWQAAPHAFVSDFHGDPGCFSILRDDGIVDVHVDGSDVPALVVSDRASRGHSVDADETDDSKSIYWSQEFERVSACRFEHSTIACDAAVVIRVSRRPSPNDRGLEVVDDFATKYAIDAQGRAGAESEYAALEPSQGGQ